MTDTPTEAEYQSPAHVPNSIGEHCTDDHSNGEVCPIHGWDSSVRPAVGYVYHDILRADGQIFTVMLKDTGRWQNSEKRDRYQEIAVKPATDDEPETKRPWWRPM